MKIITTKDQIPCSFQGFPHPSINGLLHEDDIGIGSRLKMKLLVFKTPSMLRSFWKSGLGKASLGKGCLGAVNSLGFELQKSDGSTVHVFDPRYFAIMGLCADHLGMEIITHEAVHAGISYAKRTGYRNLWHDPMDMDEEKIAYPVGKIARNVVLSLRKARLLA